VCLDAGIQTNKNKEKPPRKLLKTTTSPTQLHLFSLSAPFGHIWLGAAYSAFSVGSVALQTATTPFLSSCRSGYFRGAGEPLIGDRFCGLFDQS